jgi:hypothetical protein
LGRISQFLIGAPNGRSNMSKILREDHYKYSINSVINDIHGIVNGSNGYDSELREKISWLRYRIDNWEPTANNIEYWVKYDMLIKILAEATIAEFDKRDKEYYGS